ncbi:MAG: DUF1801 domain-containing protein [Erythrobacter sp.]|uniref:DUF1801 domain-containing protein n=1 Tax=Erythrobacter sp. TaxID=1042 RepID=UPI002B486644|nr:DUF1801 domain-containing protein [Erythrobacter sp.]WRH71328.1 MAG: DUF1801 domain-containing protein [Erythrobacter sp.]
MSEAKTTITDQAVGDFIAAVEPEAKRADALVLDAMFRRVTGQAPKMWGPTIIGYGEYRTTYESGRDVHWMRSGFSPRKAKHSLYLMGGYCDDITAAGRAQMLARLGKYSTGKSCLYINKLADVDLGVLEEIVAADWETMLRLFPES